MVHPFKITNFAVVIEIERHITKLLLSNDCVIVPGFGGFMTHHVDALYDEDDNTFYPPLRTLGFNPQLTMNDSVLAQSFIETYDISYPEALARIEDGVAELRTHIENDGVYEMSDLGTIYLRVDGHYEFEPCEAGILTPCLYGLSSYNITICNNGTATAKTPAASTLTNIHIKSASMEKGTKGSPQKNANVSLKVSFSALRNIAAACIIIALFMLFPSSTGENSTYGLLKSELDTSMLLQIMPKDITIKTPGFGGKTAATKSPTNEKNETENTRNRQDDNVPPKISPKTHYSIVLASKVSRKNAETYVNILHKKGYDDARVIVDGRYAKVVYSEYATENAATRELNKLNDNIDFADAWITKINE